MHYMQELSVLGFFPTFYLFTHDAVFLKIIFPFIA